MLIIPNKINLMHYESTMLGKAITAPTSYDTSILQPIRRKKCRGTTINENLSHINSGWDEWTAYEVAWCDLNGCPNNSILTLSIPFDSKFLIESKSLKLYLNSLNFHKIKDSQELCRTISQDLSAVSQSSVVVKPLTNWQRTTMDKIAVCIDNTISSYSETSKPNSKLLKTTNKRSHATLYTNNFRSNCPVTGQPDWATVVIEYSGNEILPSSLYKYLLSYRKHNGFHEQCIEQIFIDIVLTCKPNELEIRGYFTRRGGLDINPIRSTRTLSTSPKLNLQARQ